MSYRVSNGRITISGGRRSEVQRSVRAVIVADLSTANYMSSIREGEESALAPDYISWVQAPCKVVWIAAMGDALAEFKPQARLRLDMISTVTTDPLPADVLQRLQSGELDVLVARDARHVEYAQARPAGKGLFGY